ILYLEHRNATSERQEAVLRERLARAGVDPDAPLEDEDAAAVVDEPAGAVQDSAHAAAKEPATTWESDATHFFEESFSAVAPDTAMDFADADPAAVVQNGPRDPDDPDSRSWVERSDTANDSAVTSPNGTAEAALAAAGVAEVPGAFAAVAPVDGLNAADPAVRAAAYERLTRILEGSPAELAGYLRSGLADADPRVRRRAVLAAATAGQLALRPLLEPLRTDPDPQVRRVVREVLRHAPGVVDRARSGGENRGLGTGHSVLKGASVHAEPFDFAE
ncbi:MAG: HEAT repeat domain-containing protein, partial [Longimicrobiales bacterium]